MTYYLPATVTGGGGTFVMQLVTGPNSSTLMTATNLTSATNETDPITGALAGNPTGVVGFTTSTGSFTAYYDVTTASAAGNTTNNAPDTTNGNTSTASPKLPRLRRSRCLRPFRALLPAR